MAMSTRFVNRRRPAPPLTVPTAQVSATTSSVFAIDNSTVAETTTRVGDQAPRGPRSKPIPIPKSPHGGMNPRANEHRIEAIYAKRRMMALNAHQNATDRTTTNDKHAPIRTDLDTHLPLTNEKTATPPNNNSRTAGPTSKNPTTRALLSGLTPLAPIRTTTPATAPTTRAPPEEETPTPGPRRTDHYNGYTPVVYGGGRCTAWIRAQPPAVEQAASKKLDPTPAQRSLSAMWRSHVRQVESAVMHILAARMAAEEADRSMVFREKRDALLAVEAEAEKEEEEEEKSEPREWGFGGPEEDGSCVCLKQAGYWSEVKCGRYCEMV